jgi:hypothetical protein
MLTFQNHKYCLFLGILELNKNYDRTRKAYTLNGESIPKLFKNVCIGGVSFFYKPLCNNREVLLCFRIKLWAKFTMGKDVKYFGIGEFKGMGLGSAYD